MDACSPGEVRAISCPVAGRARKGAGGGARRLHSTAHITLMRAGHRTRGPGTRTLDHGTYPRAGRVGEGRIHGTRKPGGRAAPEVTAVASDGRSSTHVNRFTMRVVCRWILTPLPPKGGRGKSTGRGAGRKARSAPGPNSPLCAPAAAVWERPHTESRATDH